MNDLLVFGKTGQVATELGRLAPSARFLGREDTDLTNPAACASAVLSAGCRAVINAAAYTAVDRAETEPDIAARVNVAAPSAMALATAVLGIPFLHISTDYVFDGTGDRPWSEGDETDPLGIYGDTKLAGEQAVIAARGQWAILRTSWVFSAHGANFVKTMLRLGAERDELRVVSDQHGGPTPAASIAAACLKISDAMRESPSIGGIYHFSGSPDTSWAGFATEIMSQAGLPCKITPITTEEYPTPARRPANSRLNCTKIKRDFGIAQPDWKAGLADVLKELA